jgi:hypothetical protein
MEKDFERQFRELQDRHSSTYFLSLAAARWIGITLDCLSNLYVAIVVISFFFISASESV